MNWLIPLPKFGDTRIALHWTLVAACIANLLLHVSIQRADSIVLQPVLAMLILIICLGIHDAAHLVMARIFGQFAYRIIVFPTGARYWFRGRPLSLVQEILLHIAGPLVNLVLAYGAFLIRASLNHGGLSFSLAAQWPPHSLLEIFQNCNLFLFITNIVPVYPFDLGRVLTQVLRACGMPLSRIVRLVALAGDVFGVTAVLAGLYLSPWLLFLGIIMLVASRGAVELERLAKLLHRLTIKDALIKDFLLLHPNTPLLEAAHIALREDQHELLVGSEEEFRGVIVFDRLLDEIRKRGPLALLKDISIDKTPWLADVNLPLAEAFDILESFQLSLVPLVGSNRSIVGCVTERSIRNCLLLAEAQEKALQF